MFTYSWCYVRSVYSVSLCCSVYCLRVNVYCTAPTGCQLNCTYQIYRYHIKPEIFWYFHQLFFFTISVDRDVCCVLTLTSPRRLAALYGVIVWQSCRCYQSACAWVSSGRCYSKLRLWEHTARNKARLIPRRQIIKSIKSGLKLILKLPAVYNWKSARSQWLGRPLPKCVTLNEITHIFCLFVSGSGFLEGLDGRGFTVWYKDFFF